MSIDWIARARALTPEVRNFVDGRRQPESESVGIEKYGPRDGQLLYRFSPARSEEVAAAVSRARHAFEDGRWSRLPLQRRKDALHKLAACIEQRAEEFALLECLDVGKPINDALQFDVPAAVATIRHVAEAVDHMHGKVYGVDAASLSYELRRPLGVVAGIVGWNFPLVLAAQKIAPALATGNSLVLKPSEFTSLSAWRLAELAVEAGVPPGVFNVVHGDAAVGSDLALHADIDLISFTGSSAIGKRLLIASGQSNMKRLVLECGGKAPSIVFDDSPDLNVVAESVVTRAFWNQGQVCTASSRLLVHHRIEAELLSKITERIAQLKFGDALKAETRFSAVLSRAHQEKVLKYVASGKQEGAQLLYQSSSPPPFSAGFYVPPTVFVNVSPDQKIAQQEIFGPVLSVLTFKDEEEALKIANGTLYGLSAIVWTKDLGRAHRMTHGINAGWITVNATGKPSGGPSPGVLCVGGHKQSGLGVEGGIDGLRAYTSQTAAQVFV